MAKKSASKTTAAKPPEAKKAPAKKATAKKGSTKSSAKKAPPKQAAPGANQTAIARIVALLEQMDEAGLEFIHSQAEIIVTTEKLGKAREQTAKALETVSQQRSVAVDREPPPPAVGIEQKQDNAFFIRTYGKKIFFNRQEMRAIAAACHAASTAPDGARRLYTWMKRERSDYLTDTGITGPRDHALKLLWEHVVSTYAPPK
ncbi:MAG: hypothetical protein EA403_14430 [Spirochaetaceae bacterium]|nr:MAG: hypothetical protein EA403_14430 [Spirochaetaceae bacterium]